MASHTSHRIRSRRKGFVLVSVLLLVAAITLLVVITSMLAQVERTASANAAAVERARLNALFGLDVALGQLQASAGPDQRVTARAGILDSNPATPEADGVLQPHWTGVWRTGAAGLDVVNSGTPQRTLSFGSGSPTSAERAASATWLISGSDNTPLDFQGVTAGPDRDAVALAVGYGIEAETVTAPLVPILNGDRTTGAYGYWVSDEGTKARVNIVDAGAGAGTSLDTSEAQLRFLGPPSHGAHFAMDSLGGVDIRTRPELSKLGTVAALGKLDGLDYAGAREDFADATLHSLGVLADVRNGGLKADLTAALESPAAFAELANAHGFGAQMLYRTASSAGLSVPTFDTGITPPVDGLLWHSLFVHYNSYKSAMPAPSAVIGTPFTPLSSNGLVSRPMVSTQRVYTIRQDGAAFNLGGLVPVPVAYRVDIALSSYEDGGVWKLRMHFYPQLVLWNPYSVRLNLDSYQFQRNVGAWSAGGYNATNPGVTSLRIRATSGGSATTIPYFRVNQAPHARLQLRTKAGEAATMEPGETRVFALDADNSSFANPVSAINFADLVSNEDTTSDFSQQCDVLAGVDANGYSNGAPFSTPDPNAIIQVDLAAPRLRCNAVDTFSLPQRTKWPAMDGSRFMNGGNWDVAAASSSWPANLTISQLNGAPLRIIGFYVRQKGLRTSSSTYTYTNANLSVPGFIGNSSSLNPVDDMGSYAWQEVYLSPLGTLYTNGQTDVQVAPAGDHLESSYGLESAGVAPPGVRSVLRDVPTQPLVSLGQFMHMVAGNFWTTGSYNTLVFGSMFLGGSCASPILQTTANAGTSTTGTLAAGGPAGALYLDDSFLANEALFDRFFLSTIPPANLDAHAPPRWTAFNAANPGPTLEDSSTPLLNPRMKLHERTGIATPMADLRDWRKASGHLLLEGAFNVNSTSVRAWKAFLGGLSNSDFELWNASTESLQTTTADGGVLIPRFLSASGRTAANEIWSGTRRLDPAQLDELARRIVEQVKLRGPFLSMADFVNRRLGPNSPLTRSGALQAAIDSTTPDLNAAAKLAGQPVNAVSPAETGRTPSLITDNMRDATGAAWNSARGVPGYLMQQDLVQAFGPGMTVRSDTFMVRTYGEVRNPSTGRVEARAWGEAVVQRVPDFADPSDPALAGSSSLGAATPLVGLNAINQTFGRKFRVVSFRWLNENEI